jgi:acetyl-CoA carboxylase carboxyl transferase subunit beta
MSKWYLRTADKIHKDTRPSELPKGKWEKCPGCGHVLYKEELEKSWNVCQKCGFHFRLYGRRRLEQLADKGSFVEIDADLTASDPLAFRTVSESYADKIKITMENKGLKEAVITGRATLEGRPIVLGVMDFDFFGGSMGSVVGEKVTRAAEKALAEKTPLVIVSASGGARMQEGVLSLMQMAKTSAALERLNQARIPFISVMVDPTSGGVTASYAMLGDVNVAEPGALIGFAGPRVIEQTIRQKLPKGFQRTEFLIDHGFIDIMFHRHELKAGLVRILDYLSGGGQKA